MEYEEFNKNFLELQARGLDDWLDIDQLKINQKEDLVNSPSHYTQGGQEAIVTIEDAISSAPGPVTGMLQGNALKYLIRLWSKNNAIQDAKKARWYLDRLIARLEGKIE